MVSEAIAANKAKNRTAEHYGLVYVALDEPVAPVPDFPEFDDDSYRMIRPGEWPWHASAARFVENAIAISHLPIVHPGLLADPDATVIAPFEMEETNRGFAFSAKRNDVDEAMFGEATFDESDDEKPAFEDSGDEDEAPLP